MSCISKRHTRKQMGMGGQIAGGALKGAGKGASIGSIIPGIGTGIGAAVGTVIGGVSGWLRGKKEEEEAEAAARRSSAIADAGNYMQDLSYLQAFDNQYNGKFGLDMGSSFNRGVGVPFNAEINPQLIASDVTQIEGPDHNNGGVGVDADLDGYSEFELEGDETTKGQLVFSKRLKVPQGFVDMASDEGFSVKRGNYAEVAESLGRQQKKYEDKSETMDRATANTSMLMLERIENLFDNLYYTQEFSKLNKR